MFTKKTVKNIVVFILIIIISFIGIIILVELQERKKDILYIIINNKTSSDLEIIIDNGIKINRITVNGESMDNIIDIPFKWGKNFKFQVKVDNIIVSEIILDLNSNNVGAASASGGGLITYMNIGMNGNNYKDIEFSQYKSKEFEEEWKSYIESKGIPEK
jgi:hypothetical protein